MSEATLPNSASRRGTSDDCRDRLPRAHVTSARLLRKIGTALRITSHYAQAAATFAWATPGRPPRRQRKPTTAWATRQMHPATGGSTRGAAGAFEGLQELGGPLGGPAVLLLQAVEVGSAG